MKLIGNALVFWTYTAIFILGVILNIILPGWFKSIGITCIIAYIVYRIRLLKEDMAETEKNIDNEVRRGL